MKLKKINWKNSFFLPIIIAIIVIVVIIYSSRSFATISSFSRPRWMMMSNSKNVSSTTTPDRSSQWWIRSPTPPHLQPWILTHMLVRIYIQGWHNSRERKFCHPFHFPIQPPRKCVRMRDVFAIPPLLPVYIFEGRIDIVVYESTRA